LKCAFEEYEYMKSLNIFFINKLVSNILFIFFSKIMIILFDLMTF
jgi:hypothetical protein